MGILEGKIALVTGASRGIGYAVAKAYAKEGAQVIALARTVSGLEKLDDEIKSFGGKSPVLMPFDLSNIDELENLGPTIASRFDHIDIFVSNAGALGTMGSLARSKMKISEDVIKVNLLSNFQLIRTLDPLLQNSDAGRVIFVSSGAAHGARANWGAYSVSKAGLEQLAYVYAAENETTNVNVSIVDPGRVRTKMRADAYPGEDPMERPEPDEIVGKFIELAKDDFVENGKIYNVYSN